MYQPTTRLLTVLELLQARGSMGGAELSERLEVDRRSIRRYVMMLQDLGVPIEGTRGPHGGYRLRPGYKLPPLMFTDQEAVALTLALIASPRLGLAVDPAASNGALAKLERVLPISARERVQAVQSAIALDPAIPDAAAGSDTVALLSEAAQRCFQVRLSYRSGVGQATERTVDPYGVVNIGRRWYLAGFCHLRQDARTFRIDRIANVTGSDQSFERPSEINTLGMVLDSIRSVPGAHKVDVILHMPLSRAVRIIGAGYGLLETEGDDTRFRMQSDDLDDIARMLVGLNVELTIVGPDELCAAFERLAQRLMLIAKRT